MVSISRLLKELGVSLCDPEAIPTQQSKGIVKSLGDVSYLSFPHTLLRAAIPSGNAGKAGNARSFGVRAAVMHLQ